MRSRFVLPFAVLLTSLPVFADQRGDNPDSQPSTPQDQLARFHVPPGFEVQLVADESQIQKPINITFDSAGRLWVTGSEMYPWPASVDANGQPIEGFDKSYAEIATAFRAGDKAPKSSNVARDSVRILSDFGPDGRARKVEIFAEGLNIPSGVQPLPRGSAAIKSAYGLGPDYDPNPAMAKRGPIADRHIGKAPKGDSAIVYSIPNIYLLTDWDGDGVAESRVPLYSGFGYLDTHGGSSSYLYWIDGWIYGTHGFRNHSEFRDLNGKVTVLDSGNTYRFKPDGSAFEIYTHGQTNPFGLTVDPLGNFYSADSHSKPVYMLVPGGFYEGIGKQHDGLGFAPRITDDDHGSSAIAGITYYADDKFPEEYRGNLFNGNPVTQKINRDKLEWHGSTPKAIRQPDFLSCDDPWFRPVQVKVGPDGALWIADFYNPIIGHYEVPLTDPRRDHSHGRIWRVVWKGDETRPNGNRPLPNLAVLDSTALITKLGDPSLLVRTLATQELVDRIGNDAVKGLLKIVKPDGFVHDPEAKNPDKVTQPFWENSTPAQRAHALAALYRIHPPKPGDPVQGVFDYARLRENDDARVATLKLTTEDHGIWTKSDYASLTLSLSKESSPMVKRAGWELFAAMPYGLDLGGIIGWLPEKGTDDIELYYAAQVGLREYFKQPEAMRDLRDYDPLPPVAADFFSDVLLALQTPESAQFLLERLTETKLSGARSGEYLRHAMLYLPEDKLDDVAALVDYVKEAPLVQRLSVADNLSQAIRQRRVTLPQPVTDWMQRSLLEALASRDNALAKRGIDALKEAKLEAKLTPLSTIALDEKRDGALRQAALEAAANLPSSKGLLVAVFRESNHMILRKRAAELLAQNNEFEVILEALPNAPAELAISICGALAKSDNGAKLLLASVEAGKTSPRFLINKAVAGPFFGRPKELKDRAVALTKDLPPEDARINALIADRATNFSKVQPDIGRGAQVFLQNCSACHRFRNAGGNVGPNLDGVVARGPARLIEDILDPNRNVDPLFRQTIIETTDGQTLIGANVREQGDSLLLADPTGKDLTVAKDHIKKQTVSALSLMPPVFETAIPAADFNDLVGYLLSPSPKP